MTWETGSKPSTWSTGPKTIIEKLTPVVSCTCGHTLQEHLHVFNDDPSVPTWCGGKVKETDPSGEPNLTLVFDCGCCEFELEAAPR